MLKILADTQIPYVQELFGRLGIIIRKPSQDIQAQELKNVDILLTRSVLRIDAKLLQGSSVKFVGSVTAGYDHLDRAWLKKACIAWGYAPGMNTQAVTDYVLCCVAYLCEHRGLSPKACIAIVGMGRIGSFVAQALQRLGYSVIGFDPVRALSDPTFQSVPFEALFSCDVVCIHTSLDVSSSHPTFHLFDRGVFQRMKSGCVLINTARGAIIDNRALLETDRIVACLDVWENEPSINFDLAQTVYLATPHIAGYSFEAKWRGTEFVYQQVCDFFGVPHNSSFQPKIPEKVVDITECASFETALLKVYNPEKDTKRFRGALLKQPENISEVFIKCRKNYPLRNEFTSIQLTAEKELPYHSVLYDFGFKKIRYSSH